MNGWMQELMNVCINNECIVWNASNNKLINESNKWMNEYTWMTLNEKTDKNSNNKSSNSPPFNGNWEQNVFLFFSLFVIDISKNHKRMYAEYPYILKPQ